MVPVISRKDATGLIGTEQRADLAPLIRQTSVQQRFCDLGIACSAMLGRPSYGGCIDRRVTSAKEVVLDVIAPSRDPQALQWRR